MMRAIGSWVVLLVGLFGAISAAGVSAQDRAAPNAKTDATPVSSNVNAADASGSARIDWHPGYYSLVGPNDADFSFLKKYPFFQGVKKVYRWIDLEPQKGVYDFSQIEKDLAAVKAADRRLWIYLFYIRFGGDETSQPATPRYMWKDPRYGGDARNYGNIPRVGGGGKQQGWYPAYWNSQWQARFVALCQALGKRFNGEPNVEGASLDETAFRPPDGEKKYGYTPDGLLNAYRTMALGLRDALPSKVVAQHINYAPFALAAYTRWMADNGIAIGGSDVSVGHASLKPAYALYPKYRDRVPVGPDVQWPDYTLPNELTGVKPQSPREILEYAIQTTNPHYMFWNIRQPYFSRNGAESVVSVLREHGPLPAVARGDTPELIKEGRPVAAPSKR
jgi:hypothetical protein